MHTWQRPLAVVLLASLAGCANFVAGPYSPDYATLDGLKAAKPGGVQVADVQPTDPAAAVNRITLRGAPLVSPHTTFANYLQQALLRDLSEIGALDSKSDTRVEARVLKNDIDVSGFSVGTGSMDVELTVRHGGTERLRKVYQASTQFESSFAGAVAIPKGQIEYARLVQTLLRQIYSDPQFVAAIKS